MQRRRLVKTGLLAGAALLLAGHTPYGQWVVYRKKHLLIGCHKLDPQGYDLAQQIVATLEAHLPEAKARVARAPHAGRLASLLGTDQLEVAVLSAAEAEAMLSGSGGFKPYGPIPLRLLLKLDGRVLVAHGDFQRRHAWLVTAALAEPDVVSTFDPSADVVPPWHPGSRAFLSGDSVP